jgi:glycosyltransferase involved in cell wall biosynthesis
MPIRNEVAFIERSLGAVLAQDYPADRLQILVVDGISGDGTRDIVRQIIEQRTQSLAQESSSIVHRPSSPLRRPPSIVLLDNPREIVPTAMNIALREARGDVIIRVDGHCEIAPDYVRRCLDALERTGADCVGGPMVTVGETGMAEAVAQAQSSPFGVGGVAFRTGSEEGRYVDTLAFGAYRRELFDRIGGFDEELVRNQDDEFNFRLTQAGGKIWLDPSIRSVYYSRADLGGLWRQYFQYGLYKVRVIQKRGGVPSWRHLVPGSFVLALALGLLLSLLTGRFLWLLGVLGPYAAANLVASVWTARRKLRLLPYLPPAFATLHFAYGLGFLWGLWHWRYHWSQLGAEDAGR